MDKFSDLDKFYRAVGSRAKYWFLWRKDGEISHRVFIINNGLSCERGCERTIDQIAASMEKYLEFCHYIFSIKYTECCDVNVYAHYSPQRNMYHYNLYANEQKEDITLVQANYLRENAVCEYYDKSLEPYVKCTC